MSDNHDTDPPIDFRRAYSNPFDAQLTSLVRYAMVAFVVAAAAGVGWRLGCSLGPAASPEMGIIMVPPTQFKEIGQ